EDGSWRPGNRAWWKCRADRLSRRQANADVQTRVHDGVLIFGPHISGALKDRDAKRANSRVRRHRPTLLQSTRRCDAAIQLVRRGWNGGQRGKGSQRSTDRACQRYSHRGPTDQRLDVVIPSEPQRPPVGVRNRLVVVAVHFPGGGDLIQRARAVLHDALEDDWAGLGWEHVRAFVLAQATVVGQFGRMERAADRAVPVGPWTKRRSRHEVRDIGGGTVRAGVAAQHVPVATVLKEADPF